MYIYSKFYYKNKIVFVFLIFSLYKIYLICYIFVNNNDNYY